MFNRKELIEILFNELVEQSCVSDDKEIQDLFTLSFLRLPEEDFLKHFHYQTNNRFKLERIHKNLYFIS